MTTLYRSPNVILDRHEWHVAVKKKDGRITTQYYFRPLSLRLYRWLPITSWQGNRPKAFHNRMGKFRSHVERAKVSEDVRRFAIAHLPRHSGESLRNVGAPLRQVERPKTLLENYRVAANAAQRIVTAVTA